MGISVPCQLCPVLVNHARSYVCRVKEGRLLGRVEITLVSCLKLFSRADLIKIVAALQHNTERGIKETDKRVRQTKPATEYYATIRLANILDQRDR